MENTEKLSSGLTGIAGEYFVAAELSLRGFMASITLRNNDSVDIHASNLSNDKFFSIQVKTNQSGKRNWIVNIKSEKHFNNHLFYVFVSLKGQSTRPEYFIVPSKIVAETVEKQHKDWLAQPGKKGQDHYDNSIRRFIDEKGDYLEKWEKLK